MDSSLAWSCVDVDNSRAIDKNEAVKHWKSAFGKISAREFFDQVDIDQDGEITLEEFQRFWQAVKAAGHSEEEILEELDSITRGESWVGFNDLPKVKQIRDQRMRAEEEKKQ